MSSRWRATDDLRHENLDLNCLEVKLGTSDIDVCLMHDASGSYQTVAPSKAVCEMGLRWIHWTPTDDPNQFYLTLNGLDPSMQLVFRIDAEVDEFTIPLIRAVEEELRQIGKPCSNSDGFGGVQLVDANALYLLRNGDDFDSLG